MRSCSQEQRRSVDRGTCGPGIQPRKRITPGRRRCRRKRKAPPGAPISRGAPESRAGTGRSRVCPGPQLPWDASGSLRTYADDERTREVGQPCSTCEVHEQRRATGGGGDGGKRAGQREPASAKRVPDTEPEQRAQCARAGTSSSSKGQEVAVHGAPASHLQPGHAANGVLLAEEGSRSRRGWRDVAALWGGTGGKYPGPFRQA